MGSLELMLVRSGGRLITVTRQGIAGQEGSATIQAHNQAKPSRGDDDTCSDLLCGRLGKDYSHHLRRCMNT